VTFGAGVKPEESVS